MKFEELVESVGWLVVASSLAVVIWVLSVDKPAGCSCDPCKCVDCHCGE
jgi:hypothetical protein